MARKSLGGMSGIASTIARSSGASSEKPTRTSAPALGALQGSLASIRDIDTKLIDDWGPTDRLDEFTTVNADDDDGNFESLKASIQDGGQQVPILVRRSKVAEGRYETIYGRRRLKACRELGIKVRANVQDIDDATALLAKGLENAARRSLSFYEKARFAQAIAAAGHETSTVRQALNLSASAHSHLTKITQNVPTSIGDLIGSAPKSGRPKWTELAELFQGGKLKEAQAKKLLTEQAAHLTSDERLDVLIKEAKKRGTKSGQGAHEATLMEGVTLKSGRGSLSLSVKKTGNTAEFASWLESNLAEIIEKSYAEFTVVNGQDDT